MLYSVIVIINTRIKKNINMGTERQLQSSINNKVIIPMIQNLIIFNSVIYMKME